MDVVGTACEAINPRRTPGARLGMRHTHKFHHDEFTNANCLKILDLTHVKVKTYAQKVKQLVHAAHLSG